MNKPHLTMPAPLTVTMTARKRGAAKAPPPALAKIESLALAYAKERSAVVDLAHTYESEKTELAQQHMPAINAAVAVMLKARAALMNEIKANRAAFASPKTRVFYDTKVGFAQGKPVVDIPDEQATLAAVRSIFPDRPDLILVQESVSRDGLKLLTAEELRKVGARVTPGVDELVLKDAVTETAQLIKATVKSADTAARP